MKYIIEHNNFGISVKSYTLDEFRETIYDSKTHLLKDKTIWRQNNRGRIPYASLDDLTRGWNNKLEKYFIVLYDGEKVIGICKIANYKYTDDIGKEGDENHYSISYCSIDRNYRGKGYLKIMLEELMKLCKEKGLSLGSSAWSVPGNKFLRPSLIKYAKKYGVEFIDHDRKHDIEDHYTKDYIHHNELTPEENEKWESGENRLTGEPVKHSRFLQRLIKDIKPNNERYHLDLIDKIKNQKLLESNQNLKDPKYFYLESINESIFSKYNTGKYTIYSTQKFYDQEKINYIYNQMKNGKYRYDEPDGIISGHKDGNVIYITEGHHRMMSALRYWKELKDYSAVNKLVENGWWNDSKPLRYFKFPINNI